MINRENLLEKIFENLAIESKLVHCFVIRFDIDVEFITKAFQAFQNQQDPCCKLWPINYRL